MSAGYGQAHGLIRGTAAFTMGGHGPHTAIHGHSISARYLLGLASFTVAIIAHASGQTICFSVRRRTTAETWLRRTGISFRACAVKHIVKRNSPKRQCELFVRHTRRESCSLVITKSARPSSRSFGSVKRGRISSEIAAKRMAQGVLL